MREYPLHPELAEMAEKMLSIAVDAGSSHDECESAISTLVEIVAPDLLEMAVGYLQDHAGDEEELSDDNIELLGFKPVLGKRRCYALSVSVPVRTQPVPAVLQDINLAYCPPLQTLGPLIQLRVPDAAIIELPGPYTIGRLRRLARELGFPVKEVEFGAEEANQRDDVRGGSSNQLSSPRGSCESAAEDLA